jgi:hypothetical protein
VSGRIPRALCVLAALLGGSIALRGVPYQVDDAYINYRYAVNLAAGSGPTFNAGQPLVEGFSSPLWLLALAVAAALFGKAVLPACATAIGLLAYLAVLAVLGRDAWRPGARAPLAGVVSAAAFALLPTSVSYAVTGLETVLFALVVAVFAAAVSGLLPAGAGLVAAAAALWVRPEGAWLPVALVAQLAGMGSLGRLRERSTLALVLGVGIGGAALAAARLAVFQSLLPNTWYAKEPALLAGLEYASLTLIIPPFLGLIVCAGLGARCGGAVDRGYFFAGLSWILAAVLEGGDWMPGGRMLLPAFTLFAMAAGGIARAGPLRAPRALALWFCVLVTLGCHVAWSWSFAGSGAEALDSYRGEARAVADWVKESGARSIALIDIGEVGYRTDLEIVDLAGLTDRRIGRAPGPHLGKDVDLRYLFEERAPDLLLLRLARAPRGADGEAPTSMEDVDPADAMSRMEGRILADPALKSLYSPLFLQIPARPRAPLNARMVFVRHGVLLREAAAATRGILAVRSLGD